MSTPRGTGTPRPEHETQRCYSQPVDKTPGDFPAPGLTDAAGPPLEALPLSVASTAVRCGEAPSAVLAIDLDGSSLMRDNDGNALFFASFDTTEESAMPACSFVPLRNRKGNVIAVALVDAADLEVVRGRPWSINNNGYAVRTERLTIDGRVICYTVRLHRLVLGLTRGDGRVVDHINRDRLDCRRQNLRVVTSLENNRNRDRSRCARGLHLMTSENTLPIGFAGRRRCRACLQARTGRSRYGYVRAETCAKGHPRSVANTHTRANGISECATCRQETRAAYRSRANELRRARRAARKALGLPRGST